MINLDKIKWDKLNRTPKSHALVLKYKSLLQHPRKNKLEIEKISKRIIRIYSPTKRQSIRLKNKFIPHINELKTVKEIRRFYDYLSNSGGIPRVKLIRLGNKSQFALGSCVTLGKITTITLHTTDIKSIIHEFVHHAQYTAKADDDHGPVFRAIQEVVYIEAREYFKGMKK